MSDTAGAGASAPGGTITFTSSDEGTFTAGDTCALTASATTPSRSSCTATFVQDTARGTTLSASFDGDAEHKASEANFQIHGLGDLLICGAAPLPACPPGPPPPKVCVSIWTLDCEGEFEKPDPVETCVSQWQNCNGFGGQEPGRPGTIDLTGLPQTLKPTVGCQAGASQRKAPVIAPLNPYSCQMLVSLGFDLDAVLRARDQLKPFELKVLRETFEVHLDRFRELVDTARPGRASTNPFLPSIDYFVDAAFVLAEGAWEDPSIPSRLRRLLDDDSNAVLDCISQRKIPSANPVEYCANRPKAPRCNYASGPFGLSGDVIPGPLGLLSDKDDKRCRAMTMVWRGGITSLLGQLLNIKERVGLLSPILGGGSRAVRPSGDLERVKKRRSISPLFEGAITLSPGAHGKVRLRLAKGARKGIRTLRKAGVRRIKGVATTSTVAMVGLEPTEEKTRVRIILSRGR